MEDDYKICMFGTIQNTVLQNSIFYSDMNILIINHNWHSLKIAGLAGTI